MYLLRDLTGGKPRVSVCNYYQIKNELYSLDTVELVSIVVFAISFFTKNNSNLSKL